MARRPNAPPFRVVLRGKVGSPSNKPGRKHWLTLLGVLAIAIQCFVVQTHVHPWATPLSPSILIAYADDGHEQYRARADQGSDPAPTRHDSQKNCYLCQTALAGATILSSAPSLSCVERNFVANAAFSSVVAARSPRSHNWQSRAPPLQL